MASRAAYLPLSPSVEEFVAVLLQEHDWYSLGVFLGVSRAELMRIEKYQGAISITRCLIELYGCLEKNTLCWEKIANGLKWLGNNTLSDEIYSKYITPSIRRVTHSLMSSSHDTTDEITDNEMKRYSGAVDGLSSMQDDVGFDHAGIKEIGGEIQSLFERFAFLALKIKQVFKTRSNIQLEDLQDLLEDICGLKRLTQDQATFDEVFTRLKQHCSILNFRPIMVLVDNLLSNEETLQIELIQFKEDVDSFKNSAKMVEFVSFIKEKQIVNAGEYIPVKLKVRDFWTHFTMKQFEMIVNEILDTLYDHMSHITVGKGCICVSWIIPPNIDAENLIPELSLEFLHIIGVLSLCIGGTVIYETPKEGCETVEAAMLQAIEMKNTRAIEVLLAVGCSLEVATFNNTNIVTNIVNIRKNPRFQSQSVVEYLCILGHNEQHIEAIVDTDWEPQADCNSCKTLKKTIANIQKENALLWQKNKEMSTKFEAVQQKTDTVTKEFHDTQQRDKDKCESALQVETLKHLERDVRFVRALGSENDEKTSEETTTGLVEGYDETLMSTAILPRQRLGIGAEMIVTVTIRGSSGRAPAKGGLSVTASLTCNKEECPVIDNGDGIYLVFVIPQGLGQHQLNIIFNDQHVKNSPFNLEIVPKRDYTKLKHPLKSITDISTPRYIAFSNDGSAFVTSSGQHCVHVYNKSGHKKNTIGWFGSGEVQFMNPFGIDISGEVVYVAEYDGHRIHAFTTGGEFVGTFCEMVYGTGQFDYPRDIKVSSDGKVYVSNGEDDRIHVFNPDWTVSHLINGGASGNGSFSHPEGIAFDLAGNVHITGYLSSSVSVFTPKGKFVRQYDEGHINSPVGICIDPSGYSLVTNWSNNSLSVFDPRGRYVHSMGNGLDGPCGVSVSLDGSVWVADTGNDRLVLY